MNLLPHHHHNSNSHNTSLTDSNFLYIKRQSLALNSDDK